MPQLVHSVNSPAPDARDCASAPTFRFCFTAKLLILNILMAWLFFDQVD